MKIERYRRYLGNYNPKEYIGVDRVKLPGVNIVCDITQGLPFGNETVDEIVCIHVLEHIRDLEFIMREFYRILKPDTILKIWVGETASISGEVVDVLSTTFLLLEREDGENTIFTVLPDHYVDVDIRDKVEVLGTLKTDYQISAEKIIVSKKWKHDFVYIRSFIALIFLIFVFMSNWKFDLTHIKFIRRE